jgi:hypothetical protein
VKVEHRQSTGPNFSSKWTVKYIESDQFEKHVDAALRFIETQIAELPAEADTTAYSGVPDSNSVSPWELSSQKDDRKKPRPRRDAERPQAQIPAFICYSHKDEMLRRQFASHTSTLENQGRITVWHDRKIIGGEDWETALDNHLESAKIIIPLLSADFMASKYCYGKELKKGIRAPRCWRSHRSANSASPMRLAR